MVEVALPQTDNILVKFGFQGLDRIAWAKNSGFAPLLPEEWFDFGESPNAALASDARRVTEVAVWPLESARRFRIHTAGASLYHILPDVRASLKIKLEVLRRSTVIATFETEGIPDATEPYEWNPPEAADLQAFWNSLPSSGNFGGRLTIEEVRDIPFPWRVGLGFGAPRASDTARAARWRAGLGYGAPRALAKARPEPFRIGLCLGAPLAEAKARPEPGRAGLGYGEPGAGKVFVRPWRLGLAWGEPLARRYAAFDQDPLRIGLRLGAPLARDKARAEPFRLGLRLGAPFAGRAAADVWKIGLGLGAPAVKRKARAEPFRLGLRLGEPFGGSIGERFDDAHLASAPRDRVLSFVELRHPLSAIPVRLVDDTRNAVVGGHTYIATRFEVRLAADEDRRAPTAELVVGNVGRAIDQWVAQVGGGGGGTMRYFEALAADGAEPEYEIEMDIAQISTDSLYVTQTLGYDPLLGRPAVARHFDAVTAPGLV